MTRGDAIRLALVSLLLAVFAGGFFYLFEKRSERISTGYLGEARSNEYFAAGELLRALGAEVRNIRELSDLRPLPPTDTVIVAPTQRRTFSEQLSSDLREWVRGGGHLIVMTWTLADDPDSRPDPLLDPLGVRQFAREPEEEEDGEDIENGEAESGPDDADEFAAGADPDAERECASGGCEDGALVDLPGARAPLRVIFDPGYRLQDMGLLADLSVSDDFGVHVMRLPIGDGSITVLTDDLFMRNAWIRNHDHGEFGARLILGGRDPAPSAVWFVYSEQYPSLWALLRENAQPVLIAALVWIAFALWAFVPRFGPFEAPLARPRRSLGEHLLASARFDWRTERGHGLVATARREVEAAWRRRQPRFTGAFEVVDALARAAGLSHDAVRTALGDRPPKDARDFTLRIRTLEKIRRSL